MLDLIIPVYKNIPGLYRSLFSLGTEIGKEVFVTIVDDCSGDNYDEVINFFQKFFPIRVIYLEENGGPGVARQKGLDRATQEYVAFLDCGDTYITPTKLRECLHWAKNNPHFYFLSWGHVEERADGPEDFSYRDIGAVHNRMHGKMYRTDFLRRYNITFSAESSRANEDIGFNLSARLIAEALSRKDNVPRIYEDDLPSVVWKHTGPSIVRAEDCAFYYRDQNMGMAINGEHVLKTLRANNVPDDIILREIYEEMVHMYIFYYAALNSRPEFVDKALAGAARYYHNCFKEIGDKDPEFLKETYWSILVSFLNDPNEPIRLKFSALDFPGFLNELETYCSIHYSDTTTNGNCSECQTANADCNCNKDGFSYMAN